MDGGRSAGRFFLLLLITATVLFGYVVWPIASALFLAAALAGVLWPAHRWLAARFRGRRGPSAALFLLGIIILLLGPVVAFSSFVVREGSNGVAFVAHMARSAGSGDALKHLPSSIREPTEHLLSRLSVEPEELVERLKQHLAGKGAHAAAAVGATLSAAGSAIFHTVLMLIALYFFLLQGDQLIAWIDDLAPLKRGQTRELFAEFKGVSYAVLLSTIVTAGVQTTAALVGYLVARVPHPLFFAGITFLTALIPAVGAGSVCLVVALLLFLAGHPWAALFLAIWAVTVVSLVDNLVKPLLIRVGMQTSGAVVFFSLIGGLAAFGGLGLLLGPLIVTFLLALLRIYRREFKASPEAGCED